MFGSSSSKSSGFLGGGESSSGESILPTFQDEPACAGLCPDLTYQQRILGFIACSAIGFLLSLIGTFVLFGGTSDNNIRIFAVLYVLGNVIALCSTGFLLGPKAQCRKMWLPTRRWSTGFYLLMIIIVFIVALLKQNVFLVLFLLVVEILAGTWYSISYIPFGRKIVLQFFRATGVCFPCFFVSDKVQEACKKQNQSKSTTSGLTNVFGGTTTK